jgi:hypothetical protein
MSFLETYILVMLPTIGGWLGGWSIVLFILTAVWITACGMHNSENSFKWPIFGWVPRILLVIGVTFNIVSALTPSQEKIALIFGGYMISNIDGVKDIPPNLVKAMNTVLEQFNAKKEK